MHSRETLSLIEGPRTPQQSSRSMGTASLIGMLENLETNLSPAKTSPFHIPSIGPPTQQINLSLQSDSFNPQISDEDFIESDISDGDIAADLKSFAAAKSTARPFRSVKSKASSDFGSAREDSAYLSTSPKKKLSEKKGSSKRKSRSTEFDTSKLKWVSATDNDSDLTPFDISAEPQKRTSSHSANGKVKRSHSALNDGARIPSSTYVAKHRTDAQRKLWSAAAANLTPDQHDRQVQELKASKQAPIRTQPTSLVPQAVQFFDTWKSNFELNIALREWLIRDFPEDIVSLTRITPPSITPDDALHVFVDFSNIYIGFLNNIKERLNMPSKSNLDAKYRHFNMEPFVSIMLRGRPTAVRSLSGSTGQSTPESWFTEAAEIFGFDVELQPRVLASTPSIERPVQFVPGRVAHSIIKSSPDKLRKWKEHRVDEALHLQIFHSVIGVPHKGTIVVASGDGATAAFNSSFPKVLLSVLREGWSVEVVSWRSSLSSVYRSADFNEFSDVGKFIIIELGDYLDFMLASPAK